MHMWQWLQDAHTNWQFDIFAFSEQAEGHALSLLSFYFFQRFDVAEKFGMDPVKLATFVRMIEKGYDPQNPYHNRYRSNQQSYAFVSGLCRAQLLATGERVRQPCVYVSIMYSVACNATLLTESKCLGLHDCLLPCPGFFANACVCVCVCVSFSWLLVCLFVCRHHLTWRQGIVCDSVLECDSRQVNVPLHKCLNIVCQYSSKHLPARMSNCPVCMPTCLAKAIEGADTGRLLLQHPCGLSGTHDAHAAVPRQKLMSSGLFCF